MKKFYYELHVKIDIKNGYSICVVSDTSLNEEEAIQKARNDNQFECETDYDNVDYFYELTEGEYYAHFKH